MQLRGAAIAAKAQAGAGGQRGPAGGHGKTDTLLERHGAGGEQFSVGSAACARIQADADALVVCPQVAAVYQVCCCRCLALQVFLPAALPEPPAAGGFAAIALRQHGYQRQRTGGGQLRVQRGGLQGSGAGRAITRLADHQISRQGPDGFHRPALLILPVRQLKLLQHKAARLLRCAQLRVCCLAAGKGAQVDAAISQDARADGPRRHRGPGRHERLAIAAGLAKELVAAQEQNVQRFKKSGFQGHGWVLSKRARPWGVRR
ncbi:hypothetical protein MASR1M59_02730 [Melaminivora sp.]